MKPRIPAPDRLPSRRWENSGRITLRLLLGLAALVVVLLWPRGAALKKSPVQAAVQSEPTAAHRAEVAVALRFDPASTKDASGSHRITSLMEGQRIQIALPNGLVATGTVNLIQHETGGWFRVAGSLDAPESGAFAFGTDGSSTNGLVQFPRSRVAYQLQPDPVAGAVFHKTPLPSLLCMELPRPTFESTTPPLQTRSPSQAIPLLSSRPEAAAVLYLDFDGETVTDPLWNGGRTITAKAPTVTNTDITNIWRRVKEDFWPFDVDVTTDLTRYTGAQVGHRMRCIVTPTDTAAPGAGGVAYVDSFHDAGTGDTSSNIPCWVFNSSVNGIAEAVSHEIGHTLGLHHDGRTSPAEEYYAGQGTGATGWAPIMGVGYYKSLVQWSKGEYLNANRTEDDLAIISGATNGFGYVADEAGGTLAPAAQLGVVATDVNQTGIITQASDVDVFVFTTGAGSVNITANPAPLSPNLDVLLELLDETGATLVSANPTTSLPASISTTVPGGIYYLRIRGTGSGNVLTTGYTAYGSIGEYTITGTIPGGITAPTITSAGSAEGEVGIPFTYQIVANNAPDSYAITGTLPDGLMLDSGTGLILGTPTEAVTRNLTLEATNVHGTAMKAFVLTIQAAGTPAITSGSVAIGTSGLDFGFQLTATHSPSSFAVAGTLPTGLLFDTASGHFSGVPTQAGEFSVTVSATNGNGTGSAPLTIRIVTNGIALDQALDVPGRIFTNGGATSWQGQPSITFDGVDAAQSGPIDDNGVAAMQTSLAGPVTISFRYRVDSEQDHDSLIFLVDGAPQMTVSGFVDWTEFTLPLASGNHVVRWEYRKDASGSAGTDSAWIDTLGITSATAPVITSSDFAAARVNVPFSYQIKATNSPTTFGLAGTLPAGLHFAAGSSGLISGTPTEGGIFSVTIAASNTGGTGTSELVISVESGTLDLTSALDQADLTWTNTSSETWVGQTLVTHDRVDAAAAENVPDDSTATMEANVDGPASVRFFWKVSSEPDYDYLSFSIDGEERCRISGEVDWQLKSFPIPPGPHHIAFRYRRDVFTSGGQNAAWVDEVLVFPREGLSGSDSFVGAQALTGTHVEIETTNLDATIEIGETGPFGSSYGHSLWWTWTAPETGRVIASTLGSTFDTIMAIYLGTSLSDLSFVASSDDVSRRNTTSRASFNAVAGQTYFITIGGFGDASGFVNFDIHYTGRGNYIGVIEPDGAAAKTAGLIQLTLTDDLNYTAHIFFEGKRYAIRHNIATGSDSPVIFRKGGLSALGFELSTDLSNGDSTVSGTMTVAEQGYHFTARRRLNGGDLPGLSTGAYTLLLEPATNGTTVAYGTGYGRAVVTSRGNVRFSGYLGDGQRASQGGALTFGNVWPCFFAPYRGGVGTLAGEVAFDPVAANNFTGPLRWRVEDANTGVFTEDVALTGTYFFQPTPTERALFVNPTTDNVQTIFTHRDAAADPADPFVTLDASSKFVGLPVNLTLKLNRKTGLFRGTLRDPLNGARQAFGGALLQSEERGAGLFDSFTGHGRVDLVPVP